jgi:hypothetical protein
MKTRDKSKPVSQLGTSKTTLILGAGASRPYGFPTAGELREILVSKKPKKVAAILSSLGLPAKLWDVAVHFLLDNYGDQLVKSFQQELFWAQTESIDEFAQKRGEQFANIARRALAAIFLQCEASAHLDGNWYRLLRRFILEDQPELPAGRLQVITFNYDRSFEVFFWRALQYTFGLQQGVAYKAMAQLQVHHVYGSLGELRDGSKGTVVEWADTKVQAMNAAAASLHLISPRTQGLPNSVAKFLSDSEFVFFLGFGFWPDNVALVAPHTGESTAIYASNHNLPRLTEQQVSSQFRQVKWGQGWTVEESLREWNILPLASKWGRV